MLFGKNRNKPTVPLPRGSVQPRLASPEGILWPAIPATPFVPGMALQTVFMQSQWWSPERLLAHQLAQLQSLIDHAHATVPWYRDRIKPVAGLAPGKLTLERLRKLPLLTRTDIQDAGEDLVTRALPKAHGMMSDVRTSGSTGRPVQVKGTRVTKFYHAALGLRHHLWHRFDLAGKLTTITAIKSGKSARRHRAWAPLMRTGPVLALNQTLPASTLLDKVVAEDPDYLSLLPSTLRELVRLSRETGKKPKRLSAVLCESEPLDPEVRQMCEEQWGVPVTENYSCMEIGIMALKCPDHHHLHVQSEVCLIEVLDDAGEPCAPGQTGRVVVTSLNNFATPLIRYELGDIAEVGPPCPCNRGLPVLSRIAGRTRNLVVLPSGEKLTPAFMTETVLNELPIRQFQLVQKTIHAIEAHLVVKRTLTAEEEARFANSFNRSFGHGFEFRFVYVDEIPRLPSGKYEAFRCEVES